MISQQKIIKTKKSHQIKQKCKEQNIKFKIWFNKKSWDVFHSSHYDWWAFPIDQPSGSYGTAYKLQK